MSILFNKFLHCSLKAEKIWKKEKKFDLNNVWDDS